MCSDRYGHSGNDADAPGSYHAKSFHESMVRGPEKRSRSRSPNRGGGLGWADNRSRSPSVDRFDSAPPAPYRSFHEAMMERARGNQ